MQIYRHNGTVGRAVQRKDSGGALRINGLPCYQLRRRTRRARPTFRTGKKDMKHLAWVAAGAALTVIVSAGHADAQSTLDAVKAKGFLQCGVNSAVPGFSAPDSQ